MNQPFATERRYTWQRAITWLVLGSVVLPAAAGLSCGRETIAPLERPGQSLMPVDLNLRVRLAQGAASLELAVAGPYEIRGPQRKLLAQSASPLQRCKVSITSSSSPSLRIGRYELGAGPVEIVPTEDGTIQLDDRRYRGRMRVEARTDGLAATNLVHVESYLKGVLRGELPRYFHRETFRAQAITARTYALYQKLKHGPKRNYDVLSTTASQVYIGLDAEGHKAVEAVDYTRGIVLTWDSPHGREIFSTYYSSTCGGMTQSVANVKPEPEIPPLAGGVACPYCRKAPHYRWDPLRLTKAFVAEQLRGRFGNLAGLKTVQQLVVLGYTPQGHATTIRVLDADGKSFDLRAEDFRLAMGGNRLKSTQFRLITEREAFVFQDGRGYGHGVGMCQFGAEGMARQGFTAGQILRHYYPSSHLTKAYR